MLTVHKQKGAHHEGVSQLYHRDDNGNPASMGHGNPADTGGAGSGDHAARED
jgi:hypothetical protein